jgi:3-deoxy-D-manno-octulosonic-acid transferase
MTRLLYSWLMWLAQPFLRRKLARRGRIEPGYRVAASERFGVYTAPASHAGHYLWVHAVSLGETRAAAPLIARLRERLPELRLLLTHGTATGRAAGAALLREGDAQAWQPWDAQGATQRFVAHFRPRMGILMETELWPNLVASCAQTEVPLVLANARLSEKSRRQARRLAWLARPAYRQLAAVWAQTEGDARRLKALGAPVQGVFGNIKFDASPSASQLAQGRAWRASTGRPVVMFASSREGEEALFLQALQSSRAPAPGDQAPTAPDWMASPIQWLIVPRHPQRFDEVAALMASKGFSVSRRSAWTIGPEVADVWVGDSLGEMALYYGLSDVALLGGSFAPLGGQNLIEAAACGCPVVMGPHTFNFLEAAELAQGAGAARRVASLPEAMAVAQDLLQSPPQLAAMAAAATGFAAQHRGATAKTADAVLALLSQQGVDGL